MTPAPNAVKNWGFQSGYMFKRGVDGNIIMFDGTEPIAGDVDGIGGGEFIGSAKTLPASAAAPVDVENTGYLNEKDIYSFDGGGASGILTLAEFDIQQWAELQNTKVVTHGDALGVIGQPSGNQTSSVVMLGHSVAKSKDVATAGQEAFSGKIVFSAQIKVAGAGDMAGSAAVDNSYTYSLARKSIMPWGEVIDQARYGACNGYFHRFNSNFATDIDVWEGDGAETEYNIARAVPDPFIAGYAYEMWVNGVALDYTTDYTVNAATQIATFVVPPTGRMVLWHAIIGGC